MGSGAEEEQKERSANKTEDWAGSVGDRWIVRLCLVWWWVGVCEPVDDGSWTGLFLVV